MAGPGGQGQGQGECLGTSLAQDRGLDEAVDDVDSDGGAALLRRLARELGDGQG